jgi:hypothetical protein
MRFKQNTRYRNYWNFINALYSGEPPTKELMRKHRVGACLAQELIKLNLISKSGQKGKWIGEIPNAEMIDRIIQSVAEYSKVSLLKRLKVKDNLKTNQLLFDLPETPKAVEIEPRYTWGEWLERLKNNPVYEYRLTRVKRSTEPEVIL